MTTRAYVAGKVREVTSKLRACLDPPAFITESWGEVRSEIHTALDQGDDSRARRLADEWAELSVQAMTSQLLNAPLDRDFAVVAPPRNGAALNAVAQPDPGGLMTAEWPQGRATTSPLRPSGDDLGNQTARAVPVAAAPSDAAITRAPNLETTNERQS